MRRFRFGLFLGLALAVAGCVRSADVTSAQLPLRRIVIYRNGVGYFERAGHVEEDRVTFKMRQRMVGDFLATLAIVERGGSSVRSASFPIEVEEEPVTEGPDPEFFQRLQRWSELPKKRKDPNRLREVVLWMDGKEHNLAVGYVAATPLWRPSYRLLVGKDGRAMLQVWGIVQNLSGEDWDNVRLALVAGAPIAFESTLGDPVVPDRPIITDQGEVIAAVPEGMTSLRESQGPVDRVAPRDDKAKPQMAPAPAPPAAEGAVAGSAARKSGRAGASIDRDADGIADDMDVSEESKSFKDEERAEAQAPPPAPTAPGFSPPKRLEALAAIAVGTGTTRYEIPNPVTVPDESATMVLLLNERVPGEAVLLFAPDPGVSDSVQHPFRVARFTNMSPGLLEKGPIAVFEEGSFLGQGMVDSLPTKATATVPFALERALAVESNQKFEQQGAWVQQIEAGQLFIERDSVTNTIYRIKSGARQATKLLIRHPRIHGSRLYKPPPGTEDNLGAGHALMPIQVRPQARAELVVEERVSMRQHADWMDPLADDAVKKYLAHQRANPNVQKQLREAWKIRERLVKLIDEQRGLRDEQAQLERQNKETRLSLKAIEKNPQAGDLRQTLTRRLADVTARLDQLTKRLVEVQLATNEQQVRFRDIVRQIELRDPLPAKD